MLKFVVLCVTYTLFQALNGVNGMDCSLGLSDNAMICPNVMGRIVQEFGIDAEVREYCCISLSLEKYCCDGLQFTFTICAVIFAVIAILVIIKFTIRFLSGR